MSVDRSRQFMLPGIDDLNKDQDEALNLPLTDPHLIIGGPGTGKSVVALLRARQLADKKKIYRVLVYNHLLESSNRHLFGEDEVFPSKTWETWFRYIYKNIDKKGSREIPTLKPQGVSTYCPIDWDAVKRDVELLEGPMDYSDRFIVIDEGQDMPPAFYEALINLGMENFYIAADQNQQIHPDKCSSRQDIENAFGLDPDETLELKTNYRNTKPIALLSQHFYPDDPASPKPKLPESSPSATVSELWTYGTQETTLASIAERILQLSDRNPKKLIGIITPHNGVRKKFFHELLRVTSELDNGTPPIQTFPNEQKDFPDFGQGGIVVINAQACKGLEFDITILADIDQHKPKDAFALKARFYVMVSRARGQVILLRTGAVCPMIDSLLPTNSSILVRR